MPLRLRRLGQIDYQAAWAAMRAFVAARTSDTIDELWLLEHPPVFTLGQAGRREHLLAPGAIPVVCSDRGGQVTYHGPGQIVLYVLLDLRRAALGVKRLVNLLQAAVVALLAECGVAAHARPEAPGVYVGAAKIAALGLRIRHGCSYHGLAFNFAMDLSPFQRIEPCGYAGLAVTQLVDLIGPVERTVIEQRLSALLAQMLGRTLVD